MRLTKASIEALALPPGKTELYAWDDAVPKFGVKVNPGGTRHFLVQYRDPGGRTRRQRIGSVGAISLDEARKKARALLVEIDGGANPHAQRKAAKVAAVVTLGSVVDAYLKQAEHRLKARSFEQVERHLRTHWKSLADTPLNDIKRADVAAQLTAIAASGHRVKATRARSALSALYTWALGEGIADANPVIGTNKPAEERSRDRVLNEAEVRAVWLACREDDYGRIVKMLLLTGQRRDEVGSMVASELDLATATWTLPSERTKNGLAHEVPLSALALEAVMDCVWGDAQMSEDEGTPQAVSI